ncbi:hypothetical protein RJT34_17135 [Clitoria ternatea]|uniref:Uncharacterized protein n=1 Tax=Clitoria ternatea TaxID=43366 RepID=A0AAN9J8R0_CLITE
MTSAKWRRSKRQRNTTVSITRKKRERKQKAEPNLNLHSTAEFRIEHHPWRSVKRHRRLRPRSVSIESGEPDRWPFLSKEVVDSRGH